jgi:L-aminopeptidase/D-esterase-like protein
MENMFKIGHYTDALNVTGCTVILCPPGTVASCHVCGSAPGSRELAVLEPHRKIETIHALLLTGGSAFGLAAADGVMRYLEERNIGYSTSAGVVPIVPAAVIFDLNIGSNKTRPNAENAYQACQNAQPDFTEQGSVGAATGATVGKWAGIEYAMKGGLGIAEIQKAQAWVKAISIVNAVGDVIDKRGNIIAGAHDAKGKFLAQEDFKARWKPPQVGLSENTVLSAILTNINISKLEAYNLARRAQNGLARAVVPTSTSYDGDIIFTLSNGDQQFDREILYEMSAEALRQAVIAGVQSAKELAGVAASSG